MRTKEQIQLELDGISSFLSDGIPVGDLSSLLHRLSDTDVLMGSTAELMSEAKYLYREAKNAAYRSIASSIGPGKPATIIKDYVDTICKDEAYCFERSERLNAAITHSFEGIRTAVSAEKSLAYTSSYSQTR